MVGGQAPGANSRGRGGKFRKFTRGGGKHFSRDLRPLDADGNEVSMWAEGAKHGSGSEDEGDEEDEESEEESEEEAPAAAAATGLPGVESREDRKKEKKARKEAAIARARGQAVQVGDMPESEDESEEDDLPANPNHSAAGRNQTKLGQSGGAGRGGVNAADDKMKGLSLGNDEGDSDGGEAAATAAAAAAGTPQSRRERESLEAQQAKERYRKLHEQGKTDEAKADLARLKIIREKREAEAARKQAERDEREALEKVRREEIEAREAKKREAALGKPKKAKK